MHRRGMMGCAGVVVCFLVLAAGISAENKQEGSDERKPSKWSSMNLISKHSVEDLTVVKLVRKDWVPNITKMPNRKEISPEYPGSLEDVLSTFDDPENQFTTVDKPLSGFLEHFTDDNYNSKLESIFLLRPSPPSLELFTRNIMLALAMRNIDQHYNVFTIEVDKFSFQITGALLQESFGKDDIFPALAEEVGKYLDSALEKQLIRMDQIHLVGFCWAGLASGYLAQYLKEKHNQKVKSVLALDPFSLGVSTISPKVLLPEDAEVVHVYHTNSILVGTIKRGATVDIVFNGGLWQPGCKMSISPTAFFCSHGRSFRMLWYAILYPDLFVARKCDSLTDFGRCRCDSEDSETIAITFPPNPKANGLYFINTNALPPYGIGKMGSYGCKEQVDVDSELGENQPRLM